MSSSTEVDTAVDQFSEADGTYGVVETATTPAHVYYVNESGVPDNQVIDRKLNAEIASAIEKWSQTLVPNRNRSGIDVFSRDRWAGAIHPFAIMSQCAWAVENDDILSTLADVVEGLTFKKMRFELNDDDQQDVWNQWAAQVDLDSRLREQFRDLFKFSQVYVGLWWDDQVYTVRDNPIAATVAERERLRQAKSEAEGEEPPAEAPKPRGRGNFKRKKKFPIKVPTAMTVFDPIKILPVGQLMFGKERFAYIANDDEHKSFILTMAGEQADGTVLQLIERAYTATPADVAACAELGIDPRRLWLMKEDAVYRHNLTRAQYERFPAFRLKPALEILDLKKHQRASDRASLIGNTNFIVVITKGTDRLPAKAPEIDNLREQARVIARLPVLVGDHRLKVEIVAPPLDNTLMESRWQVLDSRLVFKALQSFQPIVQGGNSSGGVSEMSRVVSQGLENRRHMLVRSVERSIFRKIMDRNPGLLDEFPSLAFAPKRITLDFSADVMNAILKLRDRGDVSRETTLDEFDYDQDTEFMRRAREREAYDETFQSSTPHGSPAANPYGANPVADGSTPEGGRPPGVKEDEPRQRANT